jgi:alkaline phosphatase D
MKLALILICSCLCISAGPNLVYAEGEYAPEDAFVGGSSHPYYGSLNEWNRRFFGDIDNNGNLKLCGGDLRLYGRRGQRQMLDILEGRLDDAVKYCEELLAPDPKDAESLFTLTAARCAQKDYAAAAESMKKAVEAGLPFGRFLAGPREIFEPLRQTEQFHQYVEQYRLQLIHGPMLGCLTDGSARFWVRTVDEVPVQVVVSTSKDLSNPIKSTVSSTSSKRDYTAVAEVKGLQPDTVYYYDVILDGKSALAPALPSFRTYLSSASSANFKVAFGGGAGYCHANERVWDTIGSHRPEALLLMGDNVYIDLPGQYGEFHTYTYYRRQSRPEFRRLTRSVPVFAIWDDHDCATDDVWMGPYRDKPAWKMSQFEGFQANWNNPGYGDEQWPGCWFKFSIADVDLFMLDGRFYRTDPLAANPTMLGPAQKAWLLDEVKKSEATFKVLASPVPWDFYTKSDSHDTWNGFRDEREEIFGFLEENKIDGVALISADRHRSDARRVDRPNGYPFYEFESSRLTNQHKHGLKPGAIFGYNEKQSFGLLSFDTTKPDPTVTFDIISIDNETINSLKIPLSEISHGTGGKGIVYIDGKPVKSKEIVFTVDD